MGKGLKTRELIKATKNQRNELDDAVTPRGLDESREVRGVTYIQARREDPYIPFICTQCGSHVGTEFFEVHAASHNLREMEMKIYDNIQDGQTKIWDYYAQIKDAYDSNSRELELTRASNRALESQVKSMEEFLVNLGSMLEDADKESGEDDKASIAKMVATILDETAQERKAMEARNAEAKSRSDKLNYLTTYAHDLMKSGRQIPGPILAAIERLQSGVVDEAQDTIAVHETMREDSKLARATVNKIRSGYQPVTKVSITK